MGGQSGKPFVTEDIASELHALAKGTGLSEDSISLTILPDLIDVEGWSRRDCAAALDGLIRRYVERLRPRNHYLAARAALRITDGRELGESYRRLVESWDRDSSLTDRFSDLKACCDSPKSTSGQDRRSGTEYQERRARAGAVRKWWDGARSKLANELWHEIQANNRDRTWQRPKRLDDADSSPIPPLDASTSSGPTNGSTDYVSAQTREDFVKRDPEESQFHRLVDDGAKLIAFVGQPGMGKTSLAISLLPHAPFIPVANGALHQGLLAVTLRSHGLPFKDQPTNPEVMLSLLTNGPNAPSFVILDSLESADELRSIVPHTTDSVIVATCRQKGLAPPRHCKFIQVHEMSNHEAIELVKLEAPELTAEETERVAANFHRHPLLIHHFCILLPFQADTVEQFCDAIAQDTFALAEVISTSDGQTLMAILQRSLDLIAKRDDVALKLLCFLCVLKSVRSVDAVKAYIETYVGAGHVKAATVKALRTLDDFGIVRLWRPSEDSILVGIRIDMHPLVETLIHRTASYSDFRDVSRRLSDLCKAAAQHAANDGDGDSHSVEWEIGSAIAFMWLSFRKLLPEFPELPEAFPEFYDFCDRRIFSSEGTGKVSEHIRRAALFVVSNRLGGMPTV
jgi:hypothetical protein